MITTKATKIAKGVEWPFSIFVIFVLFVVQILPSPGPQILRTS